MNEYNEWADASKAYSKTGEHKPLLPPYLSMISKRAI
jgi:hypothetical protein